MLRAFAGCATRYIVRTPVRYSSKITAIPECRTIKMSGSAGDCHSKFQMKEICGDLFQLASETDALAHCVSKDFHMRKGIAVLFRIKFGGVDDVGGLRDQKKDVGDVAVLKRDNRLIYYLITKEKFSDKPTYFNVKRALMSLKKHCTENQVTHLSMPRIGCGLDRLEWHLVSDMIRLVFKDTSMTITVYYI